MAQIRASNDRSLQRLNVRQHQCGAVAVLRLEELRPQYLKHWGSSGRYSGDWASKWESEWELCKWEFHLGNTYSWIMLNPSMAPMIFNIRVTDDIQWPHSAGLAMQEVDRWTPSAATSHTHYAGARDRQGQVGLTEPTWWKTINNCGASLPKRVIEYDDIIYCI
jgi:hypothetical protein